MVYRKVYANLACQLMVAEVKSEEAWHARYESGLASWRTLRTQHAVCLFNKRLAGEWGEPEACLVIFRQLSQQQESAYEVGLTCLSIELLVMESACHLFAGLARTSWVVCWLCLLQVKLCPF